MAETLVGTWQAEGFASTPTAPNGVRIEAVAQVYKQDTGGGRVHLHTNSINSAMLDGAKGAVIFALLQNGREISSFGCQATQSNTGRGLPWNPATEQFGESNNVLPTGLSFNQVQFRFYNADNMGGAWDVEGILGIAAIVLS